MQYRASVELAIGHGVGVHVTEAPDEPALRATVQRMPFGAPRERASRVVTLATLQELLSAPAPHAAAHPLTETETP